MRENALSRPRDQHLNLIWPSQAESLHSPTAERTRSSLFFQGTRCSSRCPSRSATSSRLMNTNRSVPLLFLSSPHFNKGVFYRSPQTLVSISLEDINSPRTYEREREPFISLKAYYETRRKSFPPPSWPTPQMVPLMAAVVVIRGGRERMLRDGTGAEAEFCASRLRMLLL